MVGRCRGAIDRQVKAPLVCCRRGDLARVGSLALGALFGATACRSERVCPPGWCQAASGYEVIVVGSGAGGGPLAARLARSGKRVLLLEAGDDVGDREKYQVPAMHALSTEDAASAWWFFVQHHADASVDQLDSKWTPQGILYPRGSALGGSTAVNAMVTVLPSPWDWDHLAEATGDASFRAVAMAPYYDRVRQWLDVQIPDPSLALGDRKVASYLSAAAFAFASDSNGGSQATDPLGTTTSLATLLSQDVNEQLGSGETTGVFRLPLATVAGHRNGTREFLLDTVSGGYPLTIVTGAFVTRVLWDEQASRPTAVGVEYVQGSHVYGASLAQQPAPANRAQALASSEVVIAGGAFNSPQILMLSGVGDPTALAQQGLDVRVPLAGVGENLQDRYEAPVVTQFANPLDIVKPCNLGADSANDPCLRDWEQGTGVYQTPGFIATVLMRSRANRPARGPAGIRRSNGCSRLLSGIFGRQRGRQKPIHVAPAQGAYEQP